MRCGRACSPNAGATSGRPPLPSALPPSGTSWTACSPSAVTPTGLSSHASSILKRQSSVHPPLKSCEFDIEETKFNFGWFLSVQHMCSHSLQSALDRNVKVLRCCFTPTKPYFARSLLEPAEPLLSQHIQMLELHCMRAALDFWGCPVIVKLVMKDCTTLDYNMTAPSLEHLNMTAPFYGKPHFDFPTKSCSPRFIECFGRLPLLESLPSLKSRIDRLGEYFADECFRSMRGCYSFSPC
jgi:hypothetical protein